MQGKETDMRASARFSARRRPSRILSTAVAISAVGLLSLTAAATTGGVAGAATKPSTHASRSLVAVARSKASHAAQVDLIRQAIRHADARQSAGASAVPSLALASDTSLGDGPIGQMVIDSVHSHIFISRPSLNVVDVLSFTGQLLKTITGEDDPFGLVVDNATNYLYIANGNDEIGRVGLVDLDIVTPPAADSPDLGSIKSLTVAGGLIWTAPGTTGVLTSVVPSTGAVTQFSSLVIAKPWLVDSPTDTSEFFVGTQHQTSSLVDEVTVSGGTPTVSATTLDGGSDLVDMAVTSNGAEVAIAPAEDPHFNLDPVNGGTSITLPASTAPAAVATSPGHGGLVATIDTSGAVNNLSVYPVDSTTPVARETTAGYSDGTRAAVVHGLVISPTGSLVFALSQDGGPLLLQGFAIAPANTATAAVALPSHPVIDTASNIVALVSFPYGTTVGGTISFGAAGQAPICSDVPVIALGTEGGAVCPVSTNVAGAYLLKATFSGSGEANASSGTATVTFHDPGYRTVGSNGTVQSFNLVGHGSKSGVAAPIMAIASDFETGGSWIVSRRGDVYGLDAPFIGSLPLRKITVVRPIRSIAGTISGEGYWLLDADGTVYTFGDAVNFGHVTNVPANAATMTIVPTFDDGGYWIVGSNGQVFTFGDAKFFGDMQTKGVPVTNIVGMAVTGNDAGYVLMGPDGSAYVFGNAMNHGSLRKKTMAGVGDSIDPVTNGYWLAEAGGGVFAFNAPPHGSASKPIVGIVTG